MRKIFILFLLSTTTLFAQINLNTGLTACYPFTGNAVDQINALNGVVNGSVTLTTDRFGNPNQAYSFPGIGTSNIELPNYPLLKPTSYLSFSAWIKPAVVTSTTQYILYTKNPSSSQFEAYALSLSYTGVITVVKSYGSGITKEAINTSSVVANTWYHVAMSIGNDSLKLWVNGVLKATNTVSFLFNYQAGKKIYLGSTNESAYYSPYTGVIDNPRFYNRKLNGDEVMALYTNDPSCFAVGITEAENRPDQISLYPNPSNGKFYLKNVNDNLIEVFDVLGKQVHFDQQKIDETTTGISLKTKGLYFVRVSNARVFKLVVE